MTPLININVNSTTTSTTMARTSPEHIIFLVGKDGDTVTYLHCSSPELFLTRSVSTPDTFEPGKLYSMSWSNAAPGDSHFSNLPDRARNSYVHRGDFSFDERRYNNTVLRALLLGCRIADHDRSCARIIQRDPLMIALPATARLAPEMRFLSEAGEILEVIVNHVSRRYERDGTATICCAPLTPLPSGSSKNLPLRLIDGDEATPHVTYILQSVYARGDRPPLDHPLLTRIYGDAGSRSYRRVDPKLVSVELHSGSVVLNAEMSEVVQRYNDFTCPGFVVEAPPGTARSMVLAAMALNYSGPGLQLFLATTDDAVFKMADALDSIDDGHSRILHIVSPETEEKMNLQSPYSTFETFDEDDCRLDVIFATVERILTEILKTKVAADRCPIQRQLESQVRRIVLDEGNALTEATLNALVLTFPNLEQIVVVGHPNDATPLNYTPGDVASELAAKPALDVMKRKRNVPVIKLRQPFRVEHPRPRQPIAFAAIHDQAYIRRLHYEKLYYEAFLASMENREESDQAVEAAARPSSFSLSTIVSCLAQKCVDITDEGLTGNNAMPKEQLGVLRFVLRRMREDGCDSVSVVAYDEKRGQMTIMERLPADCADSNKGRAIELELTSTISPATVALYSSPNITNVSDGDYEGLIIIGREAIRRTAPWQHVVSQGHFCAVAAPSLGAQ